MLADLTPEQRARLARGWVWQVGHLPARCKARITIVEPEGDICVDDPERDIWFAKDELVPDLTDPVTADGLLRTARAMWRDESLHVVPAPPDGWTLCRIARGCVESWTGKQWDLRLFHEYEVYPTEPAALLAAILAAPEAA